MKGDQVNTAYLILGYETDCCVTVTNNWIYWFTWQSANQGAQLCSVDRFRIMKLDRIVQSPAGCWFSTQCSAVIVHLAAKQLPWLQEGPHDASAESTLEGGQRAHTHTHYFILQIRWCHKLQGCRFGMFCLNHYHKPSRDKGTLAGNDQLGSDTAVSCGWCFLKLGHPPLLPSPFLFHLVFTLLVFWCLVK